MTQLRNVLEYDELSKLSYELIKAFLPQYTESGAPTHDIVGMFINKIGEFEFEGFDGRQEAALSAKRKKKPKKPDFEEEYEDDEEEW